MNKITLILSALLFALVFVSFASATGCGTLPSSLSSAITACYPVNIVNTQGSATPSGFQQMFNSLPFNALAGNVVVYNSISGSLVPAQVESNSMIWANLGANTISATSSANGIYYFGLGSSTANFFAGTGNLIGQNPELSTPSCSAYNSCDNAANVFGYWQAWGGLGALPSGWDYFGAGGETTTFGATNTAFSTVAGVGSWSGPNTLTPSALTSYPSVLDTMIAAPSTAQVEFGFCSNTGAGENCGNTNAVKVTAVDLGTCDATHICFSNQGTQTQLTEIFPSAVTVYSTESSSASTANIFVSYNQIDVETGLTGSNTWLQYGIQNGASQINVYWTRERAYPPAGVMPAVSYGSVQTPSSGATLTISPNPVTYGSTSAITATFSPATDVGEILITGGVFGTSNVVATGTGSASYTVQVVAVGTYTVNAYDTNALTSNVQTLTVNKASPIITLPSFPAGFVYNGLPATITANIVTINDQVQANDFVNGGLVSAFNTQNTFTETSAGTYTVVANSLATANYLTNTITQTLVISPLTTTVTLSNTISLYGTNDTITATSNAANPAIFGKTFGYVQTALVIFATGIIVVFIAMNLMAVVAAWFVRAHPIFALANVLITFVVLIIVNVLVNIFQSFVTFSAFASIGNIYLGSLITVFKMLPLVTLIFAILIIIFQYSSKPSKTL